jgi:hypothetical protein
LVSPSLRRVMKGWRRREMSLFWMSHLIILVCVCVRACVRACACAGVRTCAASACSVFPYFISVAFCLVLIPFLSLGSCPTDCSLFLVCLYCPGRVHRWHCRQAGRWVAGGTLSVYPVLWFPHGSCSCSILRQAGAVAGGRCAGRQVAGRQAGRQARWQAGTRSCPS